jgi:hypothetical protein
METSIVDYIRHETGQISEDHRVIIGTLDNMIQAIDRITDSVSGAMKRQQELEEALSERLDNETALLKRIATVEARDNTVQLNRIIMIAVLIIVAILVK